MRHVGGYADAGIVVLAVRREDLLLIVGLPALGRIEAVGNVIVGNQDHAVGGFSLTRGSGIVVGLIGIGKQEFIQHALHVGQKIFIKIGMADEGKDVKGVVSLADHLHKVKIFSLHGGKIMVLTGSNVIQKRNVQIVFLHRHLTHRLGSDGRLAIGCRKCVQSRRNLIGVAALGK